jgi:hypothetical protein
MQIVIFDPAYVRQLPNPVIRKQVAEDIGLLTTLLEAEQQTEGAKDRRISIAPIIDLYKESCCLHYRIEPGYCFDNQEFIPFSYVEWYSSKSLRKGSKPS